jgi:hypothetical protein
MLDGHVQLVPISPGHDYGNTVEVTAGLSPVDQVVVNPSDSLVSGIRVEINTNTQTGQQNETEPRPRCSISTVATLLLTGCMVGPNYSRPSVPTAPGYKEAPPASFKNQDGWKVIQPSDMQIKANQTLKIADANFGAAHANVGSYCASEAPTIGAIRARRKRSSRPLPRPRT